MKEESAHSLKPGLVSVVIPNYNKGKYLEKCLDSIMKQTYKNIEVIFVDDCSEDNSVEVASRILIPERDVILKLPRRCGVAWAQNIGFYQAKGEFIANQDSDDISSAFRIEKQMGKFAECPSADIVGCTYENFWEGDEIDIHRFTPPGKMYWMKYTREDIKNAYNSCRHAVCWGTLVFRTKVINAIGGNTKRNIGAEDYECCARMHSAGFNMENLAEILYYYRSSPTQRSRMFGNREPLERPKKL